MYSYFKLTAQVSAYTMMYNEIDPPTPLLLVSATIDLLRSRLWWLYMPMLDVGDFFRGSTCSSVVLLLPFLPLPSPLVCRECIQIVFISTLNK